MLEVRQMGTFVVKYNRNAGITCQPIGRASGSVNKRCTRIPCEGTTGHRLVVSGGMVPPLTR
jgi:hypothetical protein